VEGIKQQQMSRLLGDALLFAVFYFSFHNLSKNFLFFREISKKMQMYK